MIERWLFEPAERRLAKCEMDSESSRRLQEPVFQERHLVSPVAMTKRRAGISKCFQRLDSPADSPPVKNPAHQPERQLALAVVCY